MSIITCMSLVVTWILYTGFNVSLQQWDKVELCSDVTAFFNTPANTPPPLKRDGIKQLLFYLIVSYQYFGLEIYVGPLK